MEVIYHLMISNYFSTIRALMEIIVSGRWYL